MIWLDVYITFPDDSSIKCGELIAEEPDHRGKINGAFQYSEEYLGHPDAFALDPVNLQLSSKELPALRTEGIHAVFEDALPDDWGRGMLIRKASLSRTEQNPPHLLKVLGADALGALVFAPHEKQIKRNCAADRIDLPDLLDAAMKYDEGLPVDDWKLNRLFAHGSSPGGARPKVVVRNETGSDWLVKFPRNKDKVAVELIEAGCLNMASQCGLNVPDFMVKPIGKTDVLMIKRFDISNAGGRYHMISLQTLLNAGGFYQHSYDDIFQILQKYSFQPSVDIPLFFGQMVFNVAIGNTDDHLKNFCLLHKESGFCLSPVYDVLPDINEKREHVLSFPVTGLHLAPGKDILLKIGNRYNVPHPDQIIDDVCTVVTGWKETFRAFAVPDSDIKKLEWSIEKRLRGLQGR